MTLVSAISLSCCMVLIPGLARMDAKIPADRTFANFTQAFSFVFKDGKNKFINARQDNPSDQIGNYQPTISISDNSAVPANSFHRGHEWAFRFTLQSAKADADRLYLKINYMIVSALRSNNIQYTQSELPFDHGDTKIVSYQYKDKTAPMGYRVEFTRFTAGETLNQEIIIYHSDYVGSL